MRYALLSLTTNPQPKLVKPFATIAGFAAIASVIIAAIFLIRYLRPSSVHGGAIASPFARQLEHTDLTQTLRTELSIPPLNGGTIVLAAPYRTADEASRELALDSFAAKDFELLSTGRESTMVLLLDQHRQIREYDWVSTSNSIRVTGGIMQAHEGQRIELSSDENGSNRTIRLLP